MTLNRHFMQTWLCCLCLIGGCSREDATFSKLRTYRRETAKAQVFANELKESPRGVSRALADMDCYGGTTRGWSTWILENSSLSNHVENACKQLLRDSKQPLPKRIEASIVLWRRTHDTTWLVDLLSLVRFSGSHAVGHGRRKLITLLDFGEFRSEIDIKSTEDIRITSDEFVRFIENYARTNAFKGSE